MSETSHKILCNSFAKLLQLKVVMFSGLIMNETDNRCIFIIFIPTFLGKAYFLLVISWVTSTLTKGAWSHYFLSFSSFFFFFFFPSFPASSDLFNLFITFSCTLLLFIPNLSVDPAATDLFFATAVGPRPQRLG